jgi:hypothetical protein
MVEALVSFCRQTGAVMCAEGVETLDELRTLAELGVDLGQGWFVGRPAVGCPSVRRAAAEACGGIGDAAPGDMDRLRAHLDRAVTVYDVAQAAQRAMVALQADDVVVSLLDGDDLVKVDRPGWTTNELRFGVADYPATARAMARADMLAVRADDPAADAAEVRLLKEAGYRSMLAVPLVRDGSSVGLLEVFCRAVRSWSDREVRVCRYLADEVTDAWTGSSAPAGGGPGRAPRRARRPARGAGPAPAADPSGVAAPAPARPAPVPAGHQPRASRRRSVAGSWSTSRPTGTPRSTRRRAARAASGSSTATAPVTVPSRQPSTENGPGPGSPRTTVREPAPTSPTTST